MTLQNTVLFKLIIVSFILSFFSIIKLYKTIKIKLNKFKASLSSFIHLVFSYNVPACEVTRKTLKSSFWSSAIGIS